MTQTPKQCDLNAIFYIEIRSPHGQLIERRVTRADGRTIDDVHYAPKYRPNRTPHKLTNKTVMKKWEGMDGR